MIKVMERLEMEGAFLDIIKVVYYKYIAKPMINGENSYIPTKIIKKTGCPLSPFCSP